MSAEYRPGPCDHDDDVMCTHTFFGRATATHLARLRLLAMIEAKTHWLVAVTPECGSYIARLLLLHSDKVGGTMATLHLPNVKMGPVVCTLPRDRVSFDDLVGVIGQIQGASREVIESRAYILLTSGDLDEGIAALDRWIKHDHLLN
jgi:hypothetical protein